MKRVPIKYCMWLGFFGIPLGVALSADTDMTRFTLDAGGTMRCANGTVELSGTIGQPDAFLLSNGNTVLVGGFWSPLPVGDCNTDGLINLPDHADWPPCLMGPRAGLEIDCSCFDLDQDRDVDLFDAAEFQVLFLGS